jgi:hypothetical protein
MTVPEFVRVLGELIRSQVPGDIIAYFEDDHASSEDEIAEKLRELGLCADLKRHHRVRLSHTDDERWELTPLPPT